MENDGKTLEPGVSQNMKINKFMEDISIKSTKRDIVLLLISIADKPEVATDFNISLSYYLSLFLKTKDELKLSDAGILILNSTKIYARRVDYVHDDIVKMAIGLKADSNQEEKRVANKVPKKVAQKRSLLEDGNLVEIEMPSVISFKKSSNEKCLINETDSNLTCFDAPKNYFSNYKKYQEFHTFTKKRKKNSNNLTSDFVNPSLWKNSKIFDFDYEDEIDSKRNYRLFKHHIEPRYKTLVHDIDFNMYFKVQDFVEEKEEEMRNQMLDNTILEDLDNNWRSKDYITIENKVLENEIKSIKIYFTQSNNSHSKNGINRFGNILCDGLKPGNVSKDFVSDSGVYTDFSSENYNSDAICSADVSNVNQTTGEISFNISNDNDNSVPDVCNNEKANESLLDGGNEIFDKNKIIVRLSVDDEGVCFGDLDEIDKMMLSPRIITTDIAKYMNNTDISSLMMPIDENIKNLFAIDESYLTAQQHFVLPDDIINRNFFHIEKNILGFPEKILQKKKNFSLTSDFQLFMEARKYKRQNNDENCPVPVKLIRLEYLDAQKTSDECFRGFSEKEIYEDTDLLPRVVDTIEKNRSTSLDSGISRGNLDSADHTDSGLHSFEFPDDMEVRVEDRTIENEIAVVQLIGNELIDGDNTCPNNSTLPNNLSEVENDISALRSIDDNQSTNITEAELCSQTDTGIEMSMDVEMINNEEDDEFISNIDTSINIESHEETNKMIQKIQNWHRHLKPILAKSKERHHFDIFDLGTEIIDKYSSDSDIVTFSDVMRNKDPSFTSRYFLSVLLLANTNNLEIIPENRSIFEPVDPDKIKIKLMSRQRHTVSEVDNIGLVTKKRPHPEVTEEQAKSVMFLKPPKRSKKSINADDNDSGFNSFNLTSSEISFS